MQAFTGGACSGDFVNFSSRDREVVGDIRVRVNHVTHLLERDETAVVAVSQLDEGRGQLVKDTVADAHAAFLHAVTQHGPKLLKIDRATVCKKTYNFVRKLYMYMHTYITTS